MKSDSNHEPSGLLAVRFNDGTWSASSASSTAVHWYLSTTSNTLVKTLLQFVDRVVNNTRWTQKEKKRGGDID